MAERTLPLRLTQDGFNPPVLMLGDVDITPYVAPDGLKIDYALDEYLGLSLPTVTIVFSRGRLSLDFDVDLLERLLTDAKARG
jgi:hypothetical protein